MGTKLVVQKRGHGSFAYKTPNHRFVSDAKYPELEKETVGEIMGFVQDPSKDVLLADVLLESGKRIYILSAEGLERNQRIFIGKDAQIEKGSIVPLQSIPDGVQVFNVEHSPHDGGKLARTSGTFATVSSHDDETGMVGIQLPSKRTVSLKGACRATVGIACGGGRTEKPFKKAGNRFRYMRARNKHWPIVRGTAMSAYDHPHGGRSMGKSSMISRHAPPGQKAGHIAASRVGRRRGKEDDANEKKR